MNQTQQRILALNKAICQCPQCKGTTNRATLCASCLALDTILDDLQQNATPQANVQSEEIITTTE